MNAEQKKIIETQSRYIHISIPFNEEDYTYSSDSFAGKQKDFPLVTENERWEITIDLDKHILQEWKKEYGVCHVYAKIKDEGIYTLLDKNQNILCRLTGYVPNGVVPPKDGYGDYINFEIENNGDVLGWYDTYDFSDFIEKGEIVTSEDVAQPITDVQHIWKVLHNVFAPLSCKVFQELRNTLYPYFAYSGEFAYLSKSKELDNSFSIDVEQLTNASETTLEMQEYIIQTKSLWLTFGVSSPKQRKSGPQRFQIAFHLEFEANFYYIPIIDKKISYGILPTEYEINMIVQALKEEAMKMVDNKKSGIIEF